ncbi:argininosuccinate lyase C-terminal-domain-containing protein, partial [Blyttiomyces helicus]
VPFRETHHIAGHAVRLAEERGVEMSSLTLADFQKLHPLFGEDVAEIWDFEKSIDRRSALGGTSRKTVEVQLTHLKTWLGTSA